MMRTNDMAMDVDSVVDELRFLRKGEGFTQVRYSDTITLPSLLGGKYQDFRLTRMYFVEAIRTIHDPQVRDALLVAFGLMENYGYFGTVRDRREVYSVRAKRKYDTLRKWEDVGLEQLAAILIRSKECGGR